MNTTPIDYNSPEYQAGFMFGIIIAVLSYVVTAWLLSRIFNKMGIEGWKAWVPVYNVWVFLEAGGQKGFFAIFYLLGGIPFIGPIFTIVAFVYHCIAAYNIGKEFGKSGVWVVLFIFLPLVWYIVFAFDNSGPATVTSSAGKTGLPAGLPPIAAAPYVPPARLTGYATSSSPAQEAKPVGGVPQRPVAEGGGWVRPQVQSTADKYTQLPPNIVRSQQAPPSSL